ncbi:hypothetical protein, partial [Streptomyces sp. STR69]|uniref:hypothetical protein n=1 Tax=Streptomyces sp. STR69 TaxID=1796942 RepID=UPI0021C66BD7
DLTIGSLHTYYVEAGTTPVLVHNCDVEITQEQLDTLSVGPHATGEGIATKEPDPLPQEIRDAVQDDVCHTCGDSQPGAKPVKIGDHQPPVSVSPVGFEYRVFSHCSVCSGIQSRAVQLLAKIGRNHQIYEPKGRFEELMELARSHIAGH